MSELEKLQEDIEENELLFTEEEKRFTVENDRSAEWVIDRIREGRADEKKWLEFYEAQEEKIKRARERREAYFFGLLEKYFHSGKIMHKVAKTQISYQLPGGKLVLKRQNPKYVKDDEKIAEWLDKSGLKNLIKKEPKWGEMKKQLGIKVVGDQVCTADGEIIPGVAAVPQPDKFDVEVK